MNEPSWTDQLLLTATLIGAWITGEAGRAALAGAAGGLVRWLMSERKKMRDGVVSIVAGMLMARYATPLMMALLEKYFGSMTGDVQGTAGFAAGIVGMSLAKFFMGIIEAQVRRINGSGQPDA
ncbi:hypothetical protein [Paracoccus aestuariivivens]|uniref:Holin n=1 Tax=Paracoccus aestuariivivens TaxID=1820333 RepID=A0A6L6JDY3_9RHOB|nr:hypothetical protein [Paracoccus aestuariivivens]MTH79408.1 hypothetical protein [Paracoccus aestuariivivens]